MGINDQVLIAFEAGDTRRPFVIGKIWNGSQRVRVRTHAQAVHLPTGSILHAIVEDAGASVDCAVAADLQRQTAPWLASSECLLKILALLRPLIDVIEHLPTPLPSALQEFAKAAADFGPCLLIGTAAAALPLVRDLLCLSLQSLECLSDRPTLPSELVQAAGGIQGVLDLGRQFFDLAGVAPIRLSVLTDPGALASDIETLRAAVAALGGCGQ